MVDRPEEQRGSRSARAAAALAAGRAEHLIFQSSLQGGEGMPRSGRVARELGDAHLCAEGGHVGRDTHDEGEHSGCKLAGRHECLRRRRRVHGCHEGEPEGWGAPASGGVGLTAEMQGRKTDYRIDELGKILKKTTSGKNVK